MCLPFNVVSVWACNSNNNALFIALLRSVLIVQSLLLKLNMVTSPPILNSDSFILLPLKPWWVTCLFHNYSGDWTDLQYDAQHLESREISSAQTKPFADVLFTVYILVKRMAQMKRPWHKFIWHNAVNTNTALFKFVPLNITKIKTPSWCTARFL